MPGPSCRARRLMSKITPFIGIQINNEKCYGLLYGSHRVKTMTKKGDGWSNPEEIKKSSTHTGLCPNGARDGCLSN